jgi:hypothetical protein
MVANAAAFLRGVKKGVFVKIIQRLLQFFLIVLVMGLGFFSATPPTTSYTAQCYPATPSFVDASSCWEYRVTTTFDASSNAFYLGAVEGNAADFTIARCAVAGLVRSPFSSPSIVQSGLAPEHIYRVPYNVAQGFVSNPVYGAKIWEMDCFLSGTNSYVAAIVQTSADVGIGGSKLVVVNVNDPLETYAATAYSLENETTTGVGSASRFLKVIVGSNRSLPSKKIIYVVVGDPTHGEFDTSKPTVGLRGFMLPEAPITSNALVEYDLNGSSLSPGKGIALGNAPTLMSLKMRKLTSMVWDHSTRNLYLGGHMADTTLGICAFTMNSDDVIASLNFYGGVNPDGTLIAGAGAACLCPLVSKVHKMSLMRGVGSASSAQHLVVQSGESEGQRNNFYVFPLTSTGRLLDADALDDDALNISQTLFAQQTNNAFISPEVVVGLQEFPLQPAARVTDMHVVPSGATYSVFVATSGAALHSEVWASTATLDASTGELVSWGGWKNIPHASSRNVTAFASDGMGMWCVRDRTTVAFQEYFEDPVVIKSSAFGTGFMGDGSSRVRLRTVNVLDGSQRQIVMAAPFGPDEELMASAKNYAIATGVSAVASEVAALHSPIAGFSVWDVAVSATGDRYYLLNTFPDATFTGTTGGQIIVKVPADGSAITSISSAAFSVAGYTGNTVRASFFKDGNETPAVSRCIKIVAGTNPATGLPVVLCCIPDAADGDVNYFRGNSSYDRIKVLNADLTDPGISCSYQSCINGAVGHHMSGDIDGLQCVHWDSVLQRLYLGGRKSSGADPALSVVNLDGGTLAGAVAFTSGYAGGGDGTKASIQDIYQLATLHTPQQSILLCAGSRSEDEAHTTVSAVFALPLFSSGINKGSIAKTDYSGVAANTNQTWNYLFSRGDLFQVGGEPVWNQYAAIIDMKVIGQDVFVTVANSPGIVGLAGVFSSTAIPDPATGVLAGWTPWVAVAGLSTSTQNVFFDAASAKIVGVDCSSGAVVQPAWKAVVDSHSYDKLMKAINTDLSGRGGVYSVKGFEISDGIGYGNFTGVSYRASNIVVATAHKRVALGYVHYRDGGRPGTCYTRYNPDADDEYHYKSYLNDSVLQSLGSIYCSAVSEAAYPGGWIFVGGEKGVAVLRDPVSGKGWSDASSHGVPQSLADLTGTGVAIKDMEWMRLPGIAGPVYGMTTIYDKNTHAESLLVFGAGGITAFTTDSNKFKASSPADLNTSTLSVFSETSNVSERVWDVARLYHGKGVFAVGTTRGLYVVRYDTAADAPLLCLAEIVDADGHSLGSIASLSVAFPGVPTSSAAQVYEINCLASNARTDVAKHYRASVGLSYSTGALVGFPSAAVLVASLDRMTTQILTSAGFNNYCAGFANRLPALLSKTAKTLESSSAPVFGGLDLASGDVVGKVALIPFDGTMMAVVNGQVCVYL